MISSAISLSWRGRWLCPWGVLTLTTQHAVCRLRDESRSLAGPRLPASWRRAIMAAESPSRPRPRRATPPGVQMLPQGSSFTTRPHLPGTFGMVASTHWLATASGMAVLEAGGTAFDAAVAAGLVLQVVEPHMNGLGGEAPIIGYDAGSSGPSGPGPSGAGPSRTGVFVLDGQGPAPGRATLDAFGALDLDLVPGNGLLPACVPAAFGTWMLLLQRHGRMRLRDVMQYAIGYARDGYPMTAGASAGLAA